MSGQPTAIRSGHSVSYETTPELPAVDSQPIRGDVKRTAGLQRPAASSEKAKSEGSSFFGRFWSRPKAPAFLKPVGRADEEAARKRAAMANTAAKASTATKMAGAGR